MKLVKTAAAAADVQPVQPGLIPADIPAEITQEDRDIFFRVVSVDLTGEQIERVRTPAKVLKRQRSVLAVHWHPEFVPMEHIAARIDATFPGAENRLVIPTQHNMLMEFGPFAGVEVDCYASGFNQKVQLLLHFPKDRVQEAHTLKAMLEHTFKYRSSQLFDFIETIARPRRERLERAAEQTGASAELICFVRAHVRKIDKLLDAHLEEIPLQSVKNKLLRNFFDSLRPRYGDALINRVQIFLKAVKAVVKEHFSLSYFYRATEVIEEARALGGHVIIPHPEQFWPILLAGYDVDGYEVWNPQSLRYTDFLISVVNEKNRHPDPRRPSRGRLLVTMGDDCHMGEKVKDPAWQDEAKAAREIGVQPPWEDLQIRKRLITARMDRARVIREYAERLSG